MKQNLSAGIMLYRSRAGMPLEVLLVHPGGPFFKNKDKGHWTIPKGLPETGESLVETAVREFREEMGFAVDLHAYKNLGEVRQKGGKIVQAYGVEGDMPAGQWPASNIFTLEWPPHSGRFVEFPEIDEAKFFTLPDAYEYINQAQALFLDRLAAIVQA